ncbi:MAG: hypothetical protein ABI353_20845, partial [Isosphaeraceae bacterium]
MAQPKRNPRHEDSHSPTQARHLPIVPLAAADDVGSAEHFVAVDGAGWVQPLVPDSPLFEDCWATRNSPHLPANSPPRLSTA